MRNLNKSLALIISIIIVFSFCGCLRYTGNIIEITKRSNITNTAVPVSQYYSQSVPSSQYIASTMFLPETTTQAALQIPELSTTLPSVPTTVQSVQTTQNNDSPSSWTTAKILSVVTEAVNRTKAYSSPVTVNHKEWLDCNVTKCPGGKVVENVANSIIKKVVKPTDEVLSFNAGKAVNSEKETVPLLLPKRNNFSLSVPGVASATAVKNGADTVIHLQLVKEVGTLTKHPKHHAGSVGYLDAGDVDLGPVKLNYLDITYSGTTLDITVNAAGYVSSALYKIPIEISCEGSVGPITAQVECNGAQSENWIINWR